MDKKLIFAEISRFVKEYPEEFSTKTRWKKPLVGFASPSDSLFLRLKEVVRPSHTLPQDLLPTAKTVVAYFLPFEDYIQESNAKEGLFASRSWAVAYIETNCLIRDLGTYLEALFERKGYQAVSTQVTHNYDQEILLSDWSHRHVAFIAGLGRFGLNRWLITQEGCCGRLGSLVTEASLSPSPRPMKEFCLRFAGYECSACIDKCTFGALFVSDLETSDVCGKCGCGLPCSTTNPVARRESWKVLAHP